MTVEEVEVLQCCTCSHSGHWGWCDASWIKCEYKNKIKEILGIPKQSHSINSLEQQRVLVGKRNNVG